ISCCNRLWSVHSVVTCDRAGASYGNILKSTPSSLASTRPGAAKTLYGSAAVRGTVVQKNGFSKTMKSGPGPSTISLSVNSRVIWPPWPSDMTESEPVAGVAFPGGPRTIPGCQVLVAGGALTAPIRRAASRSAKQSVVAWARADDAGRPRSTATSGAAMERCMATPLEAERPRDGSPGRTKNPGLLGAGASSVGCAEKPLPREVRHDIIEGRFPGSRLSTRRPFPGAVRLPVGFSGFRYRSQLRRSGGLAPPSLFNPSGTAPERSPTMRNVNERKRHLYTPDSGTCQCATPLERLVHLLESTARRVEEPAPDERDEKPAELFALRETHPGGREGRDAEDVLPVEQPRQQQAAPPAQLSMRLGAQDDRAKGHRPPAGRVDRDAQAAARARRATDLPDERVPVGVGVEIDESLPHTVRRRVDLDLAVHRRR